MTKDQILTEAMTLNPRERDEVAEALWQSIVPGELTPEQIAEVHRRIEAIDSGKANPIPGSGTGNVAHAPHQKFSRRF